MITGLANSPPSTVRIQKSFGTLRSHVYDIRRIVKFDPTSYGELLSSLRRKLGCDLFAFSFTVIKNVERRPNIFLSRGLLSHVGVLFVCAEYHTPDACTSDATCITIWFIFTGSDTKFGIYSGPVAGHTQDALGN